MIVLACNTTSANVLDELQALYPQVPIVGVIHSTVHDFLSQHQRSVLVMQLRQQFNHINIRKQFIIMILQFKFMNLPHHSLFLLLSLVNIKKG